MAHKHEHEDEDAAYGLFGHHEAAYNAEKIIRNLILLQEHYAEDPCADCISKHLNTIIAYAQEGLTLDNALELKADFDNVIEIMNRHMKIVIDCAVNGVCKVKKPEDMLKMIQEVRQLRRALNRKIYKLEGDVTHDFLAHAHETEDEEEDIYTPEKEVSPMAEHE